MEIKVKIIPDDGPSESHQFGSMADLFNFAWGKANLELGITPMPFTSGTYDGSSDVLSTTTEGSSTETVSFTVNKPVPPIKKRGIISKILGL
jgi:hypothetical protein